MNFHRKSVGIYPASCKYGKPSNYTALLVLKAQKTPSQLGYFPPVFAHSLASCNKCKYIRDPLPTLLSPYILTFTVHIVYTQI